MGRETEIGQVWGMIRMNGIKREFGYPILRDGDTTAVKDEEKAEMLAKSFVKIHKSDNISEEGKRGRERALEQYKELIQSEEYYNDQINIAFTKTELNRSLRKTKKSAPRMDQICYLMINHLSELSKDVLLQMYNKIWEEGKIPQSRL